MTRTLLAAYLLLSSAVEAAANYGEITGGDMWVNSVDRPIEVPVRFEADFTAMGEVAAGINCLSSRATNDLADSCSDPINGAVSVNGSAMLRIYTTYSFTVYGENVYDVKGMLSADPVTELAAPGRSGAQKYNTYRVYLLDPDTGKWNLICNNNYPRWNTDVCATPLYASFDIQVRPDLGPRPSSRPGIMHSTGDDQANDGWSREGESLEPTTVPGDGTPIVISGGKSGDQRVLGLQWSVSLGRLWDGNPAGELRLIQTQITTNSYTPLGLSCVPRSLDTNEMELIGSPANTNDLRQIKAPQTFVIVTNLTTNSFELRFYLPSAMGSRATNGYYALNSGADPYVRWQVDSPDGSTNQWRLREFRNTLAYTNLLTYSSASHLWTFTTGNGDEARIETRSIATNTVNGVTTRAETVQVKNVKGGTDVVSDSTVEVYRLYPWGYMLSSITNDPGGAALVTKFTYFTNAADWATYGQIDSVSYPDGFWERRQYSDDPDSTLFPYGSLIHVVQPWMDTTIDSDDNDCLVTDYGYGDGSGSYKLQQWHDAASHGETNALQHFYSGVHSEWVQFLEENCLTDDTLREIHEYGSIYSYGERITSDSFGPTLGRLAGHLLDKVDNAGPQDSYDYEFGSWDSAGRAFTVWPASGRSNDVRQTIYHGVAQFGTPSDELLSTTDSGLSFVPVWLTPYRSTKEIWIVQNGNLVAKEIHVFTGGGPNFTMIDQTIYQRDCLGHTTNVYRIDPKSHLPRTLYSANWQGTNTWPADLKLSQTDQTGVTTTNVYDSLKRVKSQTKLGAAVSGYPSQSDIVTSMSYDAANRVLTNTISCGGLAQTSITAYDLAGRITNQISPEGLATRYTYSCAGGNLQTNITFSSQETMAIRNYRDRRLASITGTAVTNQFFGYGLTPEDFNNALFPKSVTTVTNGSNTALRWTATVTDQRGVVAGSLKPGFRTSIDLTNTSSIVFGRITEEHESGFEHADGTPGPSVDTLYDYDGFRYKILEGHDGQVGSVCSEGDQKPSTHRISTFSTYYEPDGFGNFFKVEEQLAYPTDNSSLAVLVERAKSQVSGLASGVMSNTLKFDGDTNQTTIQETVDFANKKVTTTTTVPQSSQNAIQVSVNGLAQKESSPSVSALTWHYYDALAREIATKDPLGNISGTAFDPATGQKVATTNQAGQVTTYSYYPAGGRNAGLLFSQTGPTGKKTYFDYNTLGQQTWIWGDMPYPEHRDYNQFGDLIALTTFQGGTQWSTTNGPSSPGLTNCVTFWYYDEPTGLLTNKVDATGHGYTNNYYNNWLLKSHAWCRGDSYTNFYAPNGDLLQTDYASGGTVTSVLTTNQNRLGLARFASDAGGKHVLSYDHRGRCLSDNCTNGLLSGVIVSNHYDRILGRNQIVVQTPSRSLTNAYGFDSYGRLAAVTNGVCSVTYGYLANSDLLQTSTSKNNGTNVLTASRMWDYGYRLRSIQNTTNAGTVSSHAYAYDRLDRRTQAILGDGSLWSYGYDDRDEVVSGKHYWADWAPMAGQQFEYGYDNIGNRSVARTGGDQNGNNLRSTSYTPNSLNEYSQVVTPGYEDIIGAAIITNTVSVNGDTNVCRRGEYFRIELTENNTNSPLWTGVSVIAGAMTNTGGFSFPPCTVTNYYDNDGNLTRDGIWSYRWDGENRLVEMSMTNLAGVPNTQRKRLQFTYDHLNRRVAKTVSAWNGTSAFTNVSTAYFVYALPEDGDGAGGWNLIAELDSGANPVRSYTWGLDLSSSVDGAGGIGGLVLTTQHAGSATTNQFTAYDGNGNLTALVSTNGATVARYEYGPFGELIRTTGVLARTNPFRFSTKFSDDESDLVYYGYRYYSPSLGRWINRDPEEEGAGNNLYVFASNNGVGLFDGLGREVEEVEATEAGESYMGVEGASQAISFYNRVKGMIDNFNDVQQFMAGVMDASNGDFTDLFSKLCALSKQALSSGVAETHDHHVLPLGRGTTDFADMWKSAGIDPDRFMINMNKFLHQRIHGRAGGKWNKAWKMFRAMQASPPGAERIMGFAFGMLKTIGMGAVPFL